MDRIRRLAELLPNYAGLSDAEICRAMNEKTITELRETFITDRRLFAELGAAKAVPIRLAMQQVTDPALIWAWEMMSDRGASGIDIALPEARGLILALAANPDFPLAQEDAEAILALAEHQISLAQQEGIGRVSGVDVRAARRVTL